MRIQSITISGFRCFDSSGQTINLRDFNCFIGPNASGKTAAMTALGRLFGEAAFQRQIAFSDFHLEPGEKLDSKPERRLFIECRIEFPELDSEEDGDDLSSIPDAFRQMTIDEPGKAPHCRIRLEASWTKKDPEEIEQSLFWIATESTVPSEMEGKRYKVASSDRKLIRTFYIPAARDPYQQIRNTTATSYGRLMASLAWNGSDVTIKEKLSSLREGIGDLTAIQTINSHVQEDWTQLYGGSVAKEIAFRALEDEPAALLKLLAPTFRPGESENTIETHDLSDGLRSLFSFALSVGLFRIEDGLRSNASNLGFQSEAADHTPFLTIFAVEEPENHLSPHYLGRVMSRLRDVATRTRSQVIISSHSASILARVEPEEVFYFLGKQATRTTSVNKLSLPNSSDEAFKYVREAVRGYPELYFSRLVVLAEGPSEQIVLRRLFEAHGSPLDAHFISVVPLGGKHVNHFWRLLHDLDIPFLTLLDLDREKEGAGWGRIQYVRDQLVERYGKDSPALKISSETGEIIDLSDNVYGRIASWPNDDLLLMEKWLCILRDQFNIFFSAPLDLDFSLLEAFPGVYKKQAPARGGPRYPSLNTPEYSDFVSERMISVLAANTKSPEANLGSTYTTTQRELFGWYKYLFLDRSKPVAHITAMSDLSNNDLVVHAPQSLKHLVKAANRVLKDERY